MDPRTNPYAPGAGKTVLLSRIAQEAEHKGCAVVAVETPEKRSLPALIAPALRSALLKIDRTVQRGALVKKALYILAGFVEAMKIKYLRSMAELNEDSCRSGDIAHIFERDVQSVAPTRSALIAKGVIYSPSHGENAFTVPLFSTYMKRVIPHFSAGDFE